MFKDKQARPAKRSKYGMLTREICTKIIRVKIRESALAFTD